MIPLIIKLVAARPTYAYRRIAAILNRQLRTQDAAPVNHKRVCRIMQAHTYCWHATTPNRDGYCRRELRWRNSASHRN